MINLISILSVVVTFTGVLYSIYLLISNKIDTKSRACNLCICLYGIGWLFLGFKTTTEQTDIMTFIGLCFLLLSFILWSVHQLNVKKSLLEMITKK